MSGAKRTRARVYVKKRVQSARAHCAPFDKLARTAQLVAEIDGVSLVHGRASMSVVVAARQPGRRRRRGHTTHALRRQCRVHLGELAVDLAHRHAFSEVVRSRRLEAVLVLGKRHCLLRQLP
ncbi:hypothetical protein [Orgyia pseudotsugata single capsid nuclopolyhedrovirus]|nr:hypothetical protein [Orgyia pseudotsugata single capsid nuclopolyhedrovirus]